MHTRTIYSYQLARTRNVTYTIRGEKGVSQASPHTADDTEPLLLDRIITGLCIPYQVGFEDSDALEMPSQTTHIDIRSIPLLLVARPDGERGTRGRQTRGDFLGAAKHGANYSSPKGSVP